MPTSTRVRTVRHAVTAAALLVMLVLTACAPETFPEPLANGTCWNLTNEQYDIGSEIVPEPLESYWDWDGASETAVYHSYYCVSIGEVPTVLAVDAAQAELQYECHYSIYTYERLCDVPEVLAPTPTPIPYCDVEDGSLNFAHCGRPVAIYEAPLAIWGVDPWTGTGEIAFEITDEQIEAAGIPEGEPVLIAEGVNPFTDAAIHVYRLPNGEFQLNTWYVGGKPYIVTWGNGPLNTLAW